jgi:hypothetical protein
MWWPLQVATGRKTALMSMIGLRTDETNLMGVMDEDEGYENITVFSELKQWVWTRELTKALVDVEQVSSTRHPDAARQIEAELDWEWWLQVPGTQLDAFANGR